MYKLSREKYNVQLTQCDEIESITEFFQKNKVTMVKLNYQIDFQREAKETEYNGYI